MEKPSGTVTFLLTDIVGSSRLWEAHGEAMGGLIVSYFDDCAEVVRRWNGWVVKTLGDGALAAFHSAPDALNCATELQARSLTATWPGGERHQLRTALNTDTAFETSDDYFGRAINRLSRILSHAEPGGVYLSAASKELCGDAVADDMEFAYLGPKLLRDVPNPVELFVYRKKGAAWPEETGPWRQSPGTVDVSVRFIGREDELSFLRSELVRGSTRLVTITGPGGMGKTRLAYEFVAESGRYFRDGTAFIDCGPVESVDGLATACLGALQCASSSDAQGILMKLLKNREVLLVLDGFEHILGTVDFVGRLLRECPGLRLLVTSRVILGLSLESHLELRPLSLPLQSEQCESTLMLREAAQKNPGRLGDDETTTALVNEVCQLVEGIPLLIRLAASRLRHSTIRELRDQLKRSRLELASKDRDTLAKHANVRRVISDSVQQLGAQSSKLLGQLSLFAGGFVVADIEGVFGDALDPNFRDDIDLLRDHSLLQADSSGPVMRYRLLDSIREYVSEDATTSPDVRSRFLNHFAAVGERIQRLLNEGSWKEGHDLLIFSMGNLRQAVDFAMAASDPAALARIGPPLAKVYMEAGLSNDFSELAARLKDHMSASHDRALTIQVLGLEGAHLARNGKRPQAKVAWESRRATAAAVGDTESEIDAMIDLAGMSITDKDWDDARRRLDEAGSLCRSAGHERFLSTIIAAQSEVALGQKRPDEAKALSRAALAEGEKASPEDLLYVLRVAAQVAQTTGDWEGATQFWRRFLSMAFTGHRLIIVKSALENLAGCLEHLGQSEQSQLARSAAVSLSEQLDAEAPTRVHFTPQALQAPGWQDLVSDLIRAQ